MKTIKKEFKQADRYTFYRRIIEILGVFPPVSELTPSEKDLLAVIMDNMSNYPTLSERDKALVVFSKDNKALLAEKLGHKKQVLENMISILRKKKVLNGSDSDEPNTLIKLLRLYDSNVVLNFDFKYETA